MIDQRRREGPGAGRGDACSETHPQVADAHVFGIPHAEWGEQVVAVVAAPVLPLAELRDRVEPRSWAPHQVAFVDALPLLPNGKVDRQRARGLL